MLRKKSWNPYLCGIAAGVIFILSVVLFGQYFGTTTTFSRVGSYFIELMGVQLDGIAFFADNDGNYTYHKLVNFQSTFVIGFFVGGILSARLSRNIKLRWTPDLFKLKFGDNTPLRFAMAFVGGVVIIIGARIADGCTSWYGISSASKLDLAGFVTFISFFIGASVTAHIIYRGIKP